LLQDRSETHIYGFNGKHLGWYENGIFYDSEGDVVGFFENASSNKVSVPSPKGIKQITQIKSIEEISTIQPILGLSCSKTPITIFFRLGSK
jgi:hypothetical protein